MLFENNVVKSSEAFFRVAVGDKRSEKIAPGNHRLSLEISAKQALDQLLDPNRIPNLIRVNEGSWKSEIVTSLVKYGFTTNEISKAFRVVKLPQGFKEVEGLLFLRNIVLQKILLLRMPSKRWWIDLDKNQPQRIYW